MEQLLPLLPSVLQLLEGSLTVVLKLNNGKIIQAWLRTHNNRRLGRHTASLRVALSHGDHMTIYSGTGRGTSQKEAKRRALADFLSRIQ